MTCNAMAGSGERGRVRRRRSAVGGSVRARTGGRRSEAAVGALRAGRTRLDQDQEPRLLALGARARGCAEGSVARVRLSRTPTRMQARRDRREERVGGLDLAVSPYGLAHYVPGERGWIKTRNRAYLRYEIEREGALAPRDTRLTADVDCSSLTLGSAVFVVG